MVSHVPLDALVAVEQKSSVLQVLGSESRSLSEAGPVLRHLVRNNDSLLLNDEVVARVRGLLTHLAYQMVDVLSDGDSPTPAAAEADHALIETLVSAFFDTPALLAHAHGLALEWQLAERMQNQLDLDPVLPPLLQARIVAEDRSVSDTARDMLAAQARFGQNMRRMELPVNELPGDLFHLALRTLEALSEGMGASKSRLDHAEARLRLNYEERQTRLGLIERVIIALREDAAQALVLERAGVSLFLTALAIGSGQSRESAVFASAARQPIRLALSLTVCGLPFAVLSAQVLAIHPDATIPEELSHFTPEQAVALLSVSDCES